MSGQVQFDGMVPFLDRNTNQMVQVRVWGAFVGQGIDPHEVQPIQGWIMNALGQSAQSYDGQIQALPNMAAEWGGYVSQQLAPGIAAQFQAQGQIQIHGISLDGSGPPAQAAPVAKAQAAPPAKAAAPVNKAAMAGMAGAGAVGAAGMAMGGAIDPNRIQAAAQALSQQMGVPQDQAYQAANIVAQVLSGGGAGMAAGAMAAGGMAGAASGYHEKQAKEAARIEHEQIAAQQKHMAGQQPGYNKYDANKQAQYGKQPQYKQDPPKYDKYEADKQAQYGGKQDYGKQDYGKGQPVKQDYGKQDYGKQPQYNKGQAAPSKYDPPKKGK